MPKPKVLVVGSLNIDMILKIERMPEVGENLFVKEFSMLPGGKGNNQAVACARLGALVSMIGKVGDDEFGERLFANLAQENVDFAFVTRQALVHTGLAFIFVDEKGENRILVAPGANMKLSVGDLDSALELFKASDFLILQLEIPHEVVKRCIEYAHRFGVRVVLNPAPAQPFPIEILTANDIITPNKYEAEVLSGVKIRSLDDAIKAIQVLDERCPARKVITLGGEGALASYEGNQFVYLPAREVKVEDTTAAGDAFNGGLVVGIGMGKDWIGALKLANNAGAIACTKVGAQSALPHFRDVERLVEKIGEGEIKIISRN
ncbi:MAG: ribokinase [Candidatus Atribacteria bacterium]|nr:ribokinase [Candidatus Atribacteria bacterium]